MKPNRLILNYNDACIYQSDLALLESDTAWLNDACLHFHLARISNHIQQQMSHVSNYHVTLLDPSVVSFLVHQLSTDCLDDDSFDDCIAFKKAWLGNHNADNAHVHNDDPTSSHHHVSFIFAPINDDHATASQHRVVSSNHPRGNHWSLLLLVLISCEAADISQQQHAQYFFHIDSMSGTNARAAKITANQMNAILSVDSSFRCDSSPVECNVPQQTNGFDCGLCTLAYADALSKEVYERWNHQQILDMNIWKEWIEQTLTKHVEYCGNVETMARNLRRDIAKDINHLSFNTNQPCR
jgi:Ulp1 family protease